MIFLRRLFSTAPSASTISKPIRQRIQSDLLAALKSKEIPRSTLLRQLLSDLVTLEKSRPAGSMLAEAEAVGVLRKAAERCLKTVEEYQRLAGGASSRRDDIQKALEKELADHTIIRSYLPEPYAPAEIEDIIKRTVSHLGISLPNPSKMGMVLKSVLDQVDLTRVGRRELAESVQQILKNSQ